MRRLERKLFAIADELAALAEEEALVSAELEYHRSLADDAVRDAAVSGHPADRREAGLSLADVRRFERRLVEIAARRRRLEETRRKLIDRLG
jgi:hypothetical protein